MEYREFTIYKISKHLEVRGKYNYKKLVGLSDLWAISTSSGGITLSYTNGISTCIKFSRKEVLEDLYTKLRKFLQPRDTPKVRVAHAYIKAAGIPDCPTEEDICSFVRKSKMSIAGIAKTIGVSPSTLSRWRDGYCKPSVRYQKKLEKLIITQF